MATWLTGRARRAVHRRPRTIDLTALEAVVPAARRRDGVELQASRTTDRSTR
jgi:hypothetical protein